MRSPPERMELSPQSVPQKRGRQKEEKENDAYKYLEMNWLGSLGKKNKSCK